MSKVVLDTSALLAYLFEETGAEQVATILEGGNGVIGSANYAELASKLADKGMPTDEIELVIEGLELSFIPQDQPQALLAGTLRPLSKAFGLSLGDRACLALGISQRIPVWTADQVWLRVPCEVEVVCIR